MEIREVGLGALRSRARLPASRRDRSLRLGLLEACLSDPRSELAEIQIAHLKLTGGGAPVVPQALRPGIRVRGSRPRGWPVLLPAEPAPATGLP